MNPHFIFNSLNTIQELILTNHNDKAQKYLSKFSKLLRSILESNANDSLTVKEEIDILTKYLEIESLRFGNTFHYQMDVDPLLDIEQILIPHMLLQTFVENALWHGLLPKQGQKNIAIYFEKKSEQNILCIIDDNGVGRAASGQREQTFKRKSLALSYVTSRLELLQQLLKIPCKVDIIDKVDEAGLALGTTVKVLLPIVEQTETTEIKH